MKEWIPHVWWPAKIFEDIFNDTLRIVRCGVDNIIRWVTWLKDQRSLSTLALAVWALTFSVSTQVGTLLMGAWAADKVVDVAIENRIGKRTT